MSMIDLVDLAVVAFVALTVGSLVGWFGALWCANAARADEELERRQQ